jgi:hypothetical protein
LTENQHGARIPPICALLACGLEEMPPYIGRARDSPGPRRHREGSEMLTLAVAVRVPPGWRVRFRLRRDGSVEVVLEPIELGRDAFARLDVLRT